MRGASTEDRRADTQMRGPGGYRRLEIGGHAHGADGQAVPVGHGGEAAEERGGVGPKRRNAHQPLQNRAETAAHGLDEAVRLGGRNAGFLRLVPDIHLHQQRWGATGFFHGGGDRIRQGRTVQRFDALGKADRGQGLIRLQPADQMQRKPWIGGEQGRKFPLRLLHAIFAEAILPRLSRRHDGADRVGFGDGDERDPRRVASGARRRVGDAGAHPAQRQRNG